MSARRTRNRKQLQGRRTALILSFLALSLGITFLMATAGVATSAAVVNGWLDDLPDPDEPGAFDVAQTTRIYSADGKLLARLYLENRDDRPDLEDLIRSGQRGRRHRGRAVLRAQGRRLPRVWGARSS